MKVKNTLVYILTLHGWSLSSVDLYVYVCTDLNCILVSAMSQRDAGVGITGIM